jgi:chromosome segregation protein
MLLKSLEIQGFKSFADKTKFLFDKGITGIVGPNGCGKSNIVDSMRWVLGEQKTRKLRSEKMENVIFNGTAKRKRSSLCQVTLTFENTKNILPTEYTTVAITRKLYRDGESEYLINDIACRLKDIYDLFLDTGIGPDSYAIIELKMVDDILNDKENSRRNLFEEAAGVSKYKIRKKQTLRKLEETQLDLDRVEDILFEIQKNLRSLDAQAKKARKYFEIKDKYRLVSSRHAYFTIKGLREGYDRIEKEEQGFADQLTESQSTIAKHEARLMELRKEQVDNEARLSEAQKDLNAHNARIQEIEKEKSIKNERLKYLQQREFAIQDQLTRDRKQHERLQEELSALRDRLEEVVKEAEQASATLKAANRSREDIRERHEELKFQVEGYQGDARTLERELQTLKKEQEIKAIQIEGLRKEIERNEADKSSRTDALDSFAGTLAALTEETATLEAEVAELRRLKTENDAAIEESSRAIDALKDTIYKTSRGLDARMNEYNLTKSLVDNLEGFPESVKFLKKEANWVKDAPLLSDIFYTDEAFKAAFENLLEPYLSYYVVDHRVDALQAVKLLSNASKGRANFFILEELDQYVPAPKRDFPGAVHALEIVEVSEKYQALAAFLMDRVYVVTDESAIPDDLGGEYFFITQSGSLLRRPYAMSGGSIGLFQGKRLGRAKNLEKLSRDIKKLEKELNQFKSQLDTQEVTHQRLKSQTYSKQLDESGRILQGKQRDLSVLQAREKEYRAFIEQAGARSEVITQQIYTLEDALAEIGPRIGKLQSDFIQQTGILEEARQMLENATIDLNEKNQAANQANIAHIQKQNLLEMLRKDEFQKSSQAQVLADNDAKNRKELQDTTANIHQIVETNMQNDEDVVALYEEKKRKEDHTGKLEQVAVTMRLNINDTEERVRAERRRKEGLETARQEVKERVTEIKIQLNALKERMEVEFKVDISSLDEEELFDKDVAAFKPADVEAEMLKLRQQLQSYGEVNHMAVEAYDEMKARHDFIDTQKKDLVEARQTLLDTITEIDATATAQFLSSFSQVRENFKQVFQHLFHPGDTCDLALEESDDPLEAPITIMAKPKGKRPLTINQLSGGEKTLTAVALLFAIYLLKPAPFCIFDEVDAPLDDANIDKFNNIIREFSKDSQFIIVTHNKRTMAATHVMYGVTMEEQGVSKVLPVDLVALNLTEAE